MPAGQLSRTTDGVLAEYFSHDTITRAHQLVASGLVIITFRVSNGLKGTVWEGRSVHEVTVSWDVSGPELEVLDACTCPLSGTCAHGAALIIAGWDGKSRALEPNSWRRLLAPAAELADQDVSQRRFALRFSLGLTPHRAWNPDDASVAELRVLPLVTGKRGRWIKTGTSWRDLLYPDDRSRSRESAQRQSLTAMAHSCSGIGYVLSGSPRLADFGPAVWFHLEQARRAGVELLNEYDHTSRVGLETEPAEFAWHLSRSAGDGVELAVAVVAGDVTMRLPAKSAGLVGDHGAFWQDDADVLHLARFESPIPPELATLAMRSPVTVPAADVQEFRVTTGARLAQVAPITADDPAIVPIGLREATADPVITIRVDDDPDSVDWYDLGVTVTIGDEEIVFASLFTALAQHHDRLLLPSGTWLRLDRPEFDLLRQLIDEARGLTDSADDDPGRLRVNRFQSDWWEEFARLGVIERQSQRWARAMAAMASITAAEPVAVPDGIAATLRPYQLDGLAWLVWLRRNRLGGILADDMGLGKTLQAIALFGHVRAANPNARFLVVAPTSVVSNWQRETERFAPDLGVVAIRQTRARRGATVAEAAGDAAVVITSHTLLRLEVEQYQELGWEVLVLDEAQFAKNRHSKLYQSVRRVDAVSTIAMTGTPLENSLMDLWSLLSMTAPGLYPDPDAFAEVYRKPIESGSAPELLGILRRRIAPLLRRRTKQQVLPDLPPKVEQELAIPLSDQHLAIYQKWLQRERQKVLGLMDDVEKNRFQILRSLTLLRQLAIDPALVSQEHEHVGSAKLDHLVDQLTELALEGHRALVFSQFTRVLARVKTRLDDAGLTYAYLDGNTRDRAAVIDGFKNGNMPVFLISLKSGGFGLNLTEADYCFVLDPWWNPATEVQAVDRAHRIGQDKPVMVYRYVSAGTIEEKVMELKARKQTIFDSVVGDREGALSRALTVDDIQGLLH